MSSSPAQLVGDPRPPEAWEAGFKDTGIAYPREIIFDVMKMLWEAVSSPEQKNKILRNIKMTFCPIILLMRPSQDVVKAYGHNGYFKSLEEIVFFYHCRAMMDNGGCMGSGMGCESMVSMFPPPQVDNIVEFLPQNIKSH
jgi:hypothetical protein